MNTVGLLGCGNISSTYLKNAALFGNYQITAVADLDAERSRAKAEEFGTRALSVDELFASDVDLILNLTIPAVHGELGLRALEAGKHLYNEKPLAVELAEARRMLELAEAKGLRVGCAPDTFLGAGWQTARELLDAGTIGQAVGASALMAYTGPDKWHPDPDFFFKHGAGPLFDMGPYYLTALVNFFGPVRRVSATAKMTYAERSVISGPKAGQPIRVETPTHISALLEFASSQTATLTVSFDALAGMAPNIELYGTRGAMVVGDPNLFSNPLKYRTVNETWRAGEWQEVELRRPFAQNSRGLGVSDLFAAVAEKRPHRASGALALHVLETMHAVLQSARLERWVSIESGVERPELLPLG
ncbi:MAG: Gfo/Idh/MocA family oxidoreductase [Meiothermus sp.]|nr:Gfo/Idh/MocA family oxidoreductase [Meiothermus sp.]